MLSAVGFVAPASWLLYCDEGWTVCIVKQVDVLDDSSEGLPVSLVKHGLVDGRKAIFFLLAHLVRLSVELRGLIRDDVCFVSGNTAGAKTRM